MNNLTRKEMAEAMHDQLGYSQTACAALVDAFLDRMKNYLLVTKTAKSSGHSVATGKGVKSAKVAQGSKMTPVDNTIKLVHFGTFTVRDKQPRRGRNPRTGELLIIKPRKMVSFRPCKQLREEINE
jgi:integration host factor subunit alpha